MPKSKKIVAIIPARRDSKRCPRKNFRLLGDKPLIAWTIDAALAAKQIGSVVVTTDDEEILNLKSIYPRVVFLNRPAHLATDDATSLSVVNHVLEHCVETFEHFILLQPTSPFRTSEHIDAAIKKMQQKKMKQCVSVCRVSKPTAWFYWRNTDGVLGTSQDPNTTLVTLNGALYLSDIHYFKDVQKFVGEQCLGFLMDDTTSLDIDTETDFSRASAIYQTRLIDLT